MSKLGQRNTWVLLTGQIRRGAEFKHMLRACLAMREQGLAQEVLFSTWQGEIDRFPGLRAELSQAGVHLVESETTEATPTLDPRVNGHVLMQKKAFFLGLQAIPPEAYVLKTRTDLAQPRFEAAVRTLTRCDLDPPPGSPLLNARMFTYDARTDFLFYWDDIVLSGQCRDLLGLLNFEVAFDVIYRNNEFAAELRYFAWFFFHHYPVLHHFHAHVNTRAFAQATQAWAADASGARPAYPSFLLRTLAAHFDILNRYVLLPVDEPPFPFPERLSLEDLFRASGSLGITEFPTPWRSHKLTSGRTLAVLCNADVRGSAEIAALRALMAEMPAASEIPPASLARELAQVDEFGRHYRAPLRRSITTYSAPAARQPLGDSFDRLELPESRLGWWGGKRLWIGKRWRHLARAVEQIRREP